jgi:hypothetical protein
MVSILSQSFAAILSGLDVRVQRLLYSGDLNGELSKLLREISILGRG